MPCWRMGVAQRVAMNQGAVFRVKRGNVPVAVGLPCLLLFAFLVLPYSFAPHHSQFFPSPVYVESVKYFAMLTAALCAMFGFALAVYLPFNLWMRVTWLQHLLNIVLVPIAFAAYGHLFVTTTIPLDVALLWGEETSMMFAVESLEHTGRKSCKTSVRLAGMPMLNNTLCNLPPSVPQQLTSGTEIVVTGRGTHMGLFAENAHLRRPAPP